MLETFLRRADVPLRLAVVASPSRGTFNLIKKLWDANHTVFPIHPARCGYLNHLLTEGRCQGMLSPMSSLDTTVRQLNIPFVKYTVTDELSTKPSIGSLLLEGMFSGSSIPLAALVDAKILENHAHVNRQVAGETGKVISFSKHWILDAVSFESHTEFLDDKKVSPTTVIVDPELLGEFSSAINEGMISPDCIERVIISISESFNTSSLQEEVRKILPSVHRIDLRFIVAEFGPIAKIIRLDSFNGFVSIVAHDSAHVKVENENLLVSSPFKFSRYIGRPRTSQTCIRPDGFFVSPIRQVSVPSEVVDKPLLRRKRRIMQPEWRIRQVPLAVYHKKRGFKGQIYYTTKHKGWSLYRSRYYN